MKKIIITVMALMVLVTQASAVAVGISPGRKDIHVAEKQESLVFFLISNGDTQGVNVDVFSSNPEIAWPYKWCDEGSYDECTLINGRPVLVPSRQGKVIMVKVMPLPAGEWNVHISALVSSTASGAGMSTRSSVNAVLTITSGPGGKSITEVDLPVTTTKPTTTTTIANCGDGICDVFESLESCPVDCETETDSSTTGWVLLTILVVLPVVAVVVILYNKFLR